LEETTKPKQERCGSGINIQAKKPPYALDKQQGRGEGGGGEKDICICALSPGNHSLIAKGPVKLKKHIDKPRDLLFFLEKSYTDRQQNKVLKNENFENFPSEIRFKRNSHTFALKSHTNVRQFTKYRRKE
jgi:hypothetical protein